MPDRVLISEIRPTERLLNRSQSENTIPKSKVNVIARPLWAEAIPLQFIEEGLLRSRSLARNDVKQAWCDLLRLTYELALNADLILRAV